MAWTQCIQESSSSVSIRHSSRSYHINLTDGILDHILQCSHPNIQWYVDAWIRNTIYFTSSVLTYFGLGSVQIKNTDVSQFVHQSSQKPINEHQNIPHLGVDEYLSGNRHHGHGSQLIRTILRPNRHHYIHVSNFIVIAERYYYNSSHESIYFCIYCSHTHYIWAQFTPAAELSQYC